MFSTYAYAVISNNINCYLRYVRKHKKRNISINTEINEDLTLEDILADENQNLDYLLSKFCIEEVINKLKLTEKESLIIKLRLDGKKQRQIAEIIGMSQANVSRTQNKIKNKIIKLLN